MNNNFMLPIHDKIIELIFQISNPHSSFAQKSFARKGEVLEEMVNSLKREEVLNHLDFAGVISEKFSHDSTEEKLYAKYYDSLMARGLQELGFKANTVDARGNSADVYAIGEGMRWLEMLRHFA